VSLLSLLLFGSLVVSFEAHWFISGLLFFQPLDFLLTLIAGLLKASA
jgi:hypothetical protein